MPPRIIVKKREGEPFAEISFTHGEEETRQTNIEAPIAPNTIAEKKEDPHPGESYTASEAKAQLGKDETVVGINRLTQKPIIRGIKKKPVIKNVAEKSTDVQTGPMLLTEEEEQMAQDIAAQELRRRDLRDIQPVSNSPEAKPRKVGHGEREEAAALARRIWAENEEKKPLHRKVLRHLGLR